MKKYAIGLIMLLLVSSALATYKKVGDTCYELINENDTLTTENVSMEHCEDDDEVKIYLEKQTGRCTSNYDCDAGEKCDMELGICKKPETKEKEPLTGLGIITLMVGTLTAFVISTK